MEMSQAYPKMEISGLNYSPYRKGKGSFKREGLRGMPPCLCEIFTIMTSLARKNRPYDGQSFFRHCDVSPL